jgi:hypothetical protein
MLWFTIVFLVLLKIPIAYLGYVIWWAVKDPPEPGDGYEGAGPDAGSTGPQPGSSWWRPPLPGRQRHRGPHGTPARRPEPGVVRARAKSDA